MNKKSIFILLLLVICLGGFVLRSTYAKFTSSYTTDDIIANLNYNFDIFVGNIEEYQMITISSGDYLFLNIDVTNSLDSIVYYGIWYQLLNVDNEKDIVVAKLGDSANDTSGSVDSGSTKTVSIIIFNDSDTNIKLKFGVKSSLISVDDIKYSDEKILVTKESEVSSNATLLSTYIQDAYNDGSSITSVNIGGDISNPYVSLNATQKIMLDNNEDYRYYGSNPNNYVWYNDELWRIVSVGNVKSSDSDNVGETRVKIIREDSIGEYSWDSSADDVNSGHGVNDWSKADLMLELNNLYYNQQSGICYNSASNASTTCDFTDIGLDVVSKNLIDYSLYHLGGFDSVEGYGSYADDYYMYERRGIVAYGNPTVWEGMVGIIYPSDYMYATDLSVCTKPGYSSNGSDYDYRSSECYSNNWLYGTVHKWTIAHYSGASDGVVNLESSGFLNSYNYASNASRTVRPVVYLKSSVAIVDGEGTSTNPYQLGLMDGIKSDVDYAYAIYSSDDSSLTFVRSANEISVGDTYNSKNVTAVYTGFEDKNYISEIFVPWYNYRENIVSVTFEDEVLPESTAYWFSGFINCTSMNLEKLNVLNVTDMRYMFANCNSLTSLDLSGFNTSNVTNMSHMFRSDIKESSEYEYVYYSDSSLVNLNLDNFDTSNVTDMSYMFNGCFSLTSLDLSSFNTSNVVSMRAMFQLVGLTSLDLSNFDTSSVVDMRAMFNVSRSLETVDVSSFNTENVETMNIMFSGCISLKEVNVSNFDLSNVSDLSLMFNSCDSLEQLDLSKWDTSNVVNMYGLFSKTGYSFESFTLIGLENWDTSNVTNMARMFYYTSPNSSYTQDCSGWNVNKVINYGEFNAGVESKVIAPTWVN